MRLQFVVYACCFASAALIACGHTLAGFDQFPGAGMPIISAHEDDPRVTIWAPRPQKFELQAPLPHQSRLSAADEEVDEQVPPAWGWFTAGVMLFVYLWASLEHGQGYFSFF